MASLNVSIPDPLRVWVEHRIESGGFATVSDYVRDLIYRDQTDAEEREATVAALVEGEQSGVSERRIPEIVASIKLALSRQDG